MNYYNITKAQANSIGYFEYAPNQAIDPFAGEQADGSCVISEKVYNLLKDHPKMKVVDFTKQPVFDEQTTKDNLKLYAR